jgi:hypothetical protein
VRKAHITFATLNGSKGYTADFDGAEEVDEFLQFTHATGPVDLNAAVAASGAFDQEVRRQERSLFF